MRVLVLEHFEFEGVQTIAEWATKNSFMLSSVKFYDSGHTLPDHGSYDLLVIMGGPMGCYEERKYSWLAEEKSFIQQAIAHDKAILGICLGSQLIAEACGAAVKKGRVPEIGWLPVVKTVVEQATPLSSVIPDLFMPFQWHYDTFELPAGATLLASSKAYANQAYQLGTKILAIQFHLEFTSKDISSFLRYERRGIKKSEFSQSRDEIEVSTTSDAIGENHALLERMLDQLVAARSGASAHKSC